MTLTKAEDNCWGWTFATANSTKRYGDAFATNGSYIFEPSTLPCGYQIAFYCVEQ